MFDFFAKLFDKLDQGLSPRDKMILIVVLLVISVLSIIVGVRYYDYIQHSPEFCGSCHRMEEAHRDWKLSRHSAILCQDCHHLTLLEQNRLLVKFVFTSDRSPEPHGSETPWKFCMECHWDAAAQGSINVARSTGHARHISDGRIECKRCHGNRGHSFRPTEKLCLECHKEWHVHGVGMEEISCLQCHAFSPKKREAFIPDRGKCLGCHGKRGQERFPEGAPMARLNCYECHRPHAKIKPTDNDCLRCHSRNVLDRRTVHRTRSACVSCHVPHRWTAR